MALVIIFGSSFHVAASDKIDENGDFSRAITKAMDEDEDLRQALIKGMALLIVEKDFFSNQYGPDLEEIYRWQEPVKIHVAGATFKEVLSVQMAIEEFNVIQSGTGIRLDLTNDMSRNAEIIFAERIEFHDIAKEYNFDYDGDSTLVTRYWLKESGDLHYAIALIDNEANDDLKRSYILVGISKILGVFGHSPEIPESIFYMERGFTNPVVQFHGIDRKIIRFLYEHLKSGDKIIDFQEAFIKHWDKTKVP